MRHVLLSVFLVAAPLVAQSPATGPRPALAAEATIYRDRWGIPHVFARTDAGAAFGFAYAQAEDYFARIELNYIQALGRQAELDSAGFRQDRLNRALEIPRLAHAEYRRRQATERARWARGLPWRVAAVLAAGVTPGCWPPRSRPP